MKYEYDPDMLNPNDVWAWWNDARPHTEPDENWLEFVIDLVEQHWRGRYDAMTNGLGRALDGLIEDWEISRYDSICEQYLEQQKRDDEDREAERDYLAMRGE